MRKSKRGTIAIEGGGCDGNIGDENIERGVLDGKGTSKGLKNCMSIYRGKRERKKNVGTFLILYTVK